MILSALGFHRRLSRISGNPLLYESLEISHLRTRQNRYVAWLDAARVRTSIREDRQAAGYAQAIFVQLTGGKAYYQCIFPVGDDGRTA